MGAGASAVDEYQGNVSENGTKVVKETVNQVRYILLHSEFVLCIQADHLYVHLMSCIVCTG